MPQVLPEGTGGSRLRAGPGGVSGTAMTSVALAPAITAAIHRRGGVSEVRIDPSLPRTFESPPLLMVFQIPPAHLSRLACRGTDGRGPDDISACVNSDTAEENRAGEVEGHVRHYQS